MAKQNKAATADGGPIRARVLATAHVDGVDYQPDSVVEADADVIAALTAAGAVDPHPDAVAFALSLTQAG